MKRKGLLIGGSIVIGILIGYNLKANASHINKDVVLEKIQYNPRHHKRTDYSANLKCIGSNLFEFDVADTADIYFKNKGDSSVEWIIKYENEDTPVITSILEAGEETPSKMYSIKKGTYKLSLNGNIDSKIDFDIKIKQLY